MTPAGRGDMTPAGWPPPEEIAVDPWPAPPPPLADRVLAAVAHGAILFGLLGVGFLLALGISLGIRLYGRRSPFVAFHARQAGCYQGLVFVSNIGLVVGILLLLGFNLLYPQWTFVGTLTGALLLAGLVWFAGTILLGAFAAIWVLLGRPFAYPGIPDKTPRGGP